MKRNKNNDEAGSTKGMNEKNTGKNRKNRRRLEEDLDLGGG